MTIYAIQNEKMLIKTKEHQLMKLYIKKGNLEGGIRKLSLKRKSKNHGKKIYALSSFSWTFSTRMIKV